MIDFSELEFVIIPTRKCNFRCIYCPVYFSNEKLSRDLIMDAINKFIQYGGQHIRFTGGEPFIEWKNLEKIFDFVLKNFRSKINIEVCTNGFLLSSEVISKLKNEYITLVLSIDGRKETFGKNRILNIKNQNKFEIIKNSLSHLINNNRYIITQTISQSGSANAFDDFIYLWSLGIRNFNFLPVYYRIWDPKEIKNLKNNLHLIASFIRPFVYEGKVTVRNIERKGIIPLFGKSICLDSDGKFYYTNAVLLKALRKKKKSLFLGNTMEEATKNIQGFLSNQTAESIIGSCFSKQTLRCNEKVDRILSNFVSELKSSQFHLYRYKKEREAKRLEIHISYKCTNNCIFCSERHRLEKFENNELNPSQIWGALLRHRESGGNYVNFTGGEPTLYPYFLHFLEGAKKIGLRTYIGTNGVMLSKPQFASKALPLIDELSLSLHGHDSNIHDSCTRVSGSFNNIMETAKLAKILNNKIFLMANMVVTEKNFHSIIPTVKLASSIGVQQMLISFPSPEGRAFDNYKNIVVPFERWKEEIEKIAHFSKSLGMSIRFFGIPACILGRWAMMSNDLYFDPRITVERTKTKTGKTIMSAVITRTPKRGRTKIKVCKNCKMNELCGGIFRHYLKIFGQKEFKPF